jgi:hypothetical protein
LDEGEGKRPGNGPGEQGGKEELWKREGQGTPESEREFKPLSAEYLKVTSGSLLRSEHAAREDKGVL